MNKDGLLNPIIEGKKIYGIYIFAEIKNFIEITEILQEDVMIFANKIGNIIHSTVDEFCGSPNKNLGES